MKKNRHETGDYSKFTNTVNFLERIGFKGILDDRCLEYRTYEIVTKDLKICVFSENYPHENLKGKIVADFADMFDKWANAYYQRNFPKSKRQQKRVQSELKNIIIKEHRDRSVNFKYYPYND